MNFEKIHILLLILIVAIGAYFYVFKRESPGKKKMILTFMGAPGSGKGTIAEHAVADLNFKTLSTGNLLREAVASGTEMGKKVASSMKEGKLVSDELVTSLVSEWLTKNFKDIDRLILDGYPRTANQAELFFALLKDKFFGVDFHVVEIVIPDEEVVKRLTSRLVCEKCQAPYSRLTITTDSAKAACEKCGGKLIQRADDTEDVIRQRLSVYAQNANALRNTYRVLGVPIIVVDVTGKTKDQIYNEFKTLLKDHGLI